MREKVFFAGLVLVLFRGFAASTGTQGDCLKSMLTVLENPHSHNARIYSQLSELKEWMPEKTVDGVADIWLQRGGDAQLKAHYLLTQIGPGSGGDFERSLKFVPVSERLAFWRELDRETSFRLFRNLAQSPELSELLKRGMAESFEFRREGFPTGGEEGAKVFKMGHFGKLEVRLTVPFEMQATPVTQLQWTLVMEDNPSLFLEGSQKITLEGREILVDPNRPVEKVSWWEAQEFIERLNSFQDKYTYDLPTEAEWEFAARGGTKTRYPFGYSESKALSHAWFVRNAGGRTHPVARFPPNRFGLYDMSGQVWEWTKDWYGDLPLGSVTDPTGSNSGTWPVIRGGAWNSNASQLRSSFREKRRPDTHGEHVGFRMVRRPR